MNFKQAVFEALDKNPLTETDPFLLYAILCDIVGNDYRAKKAAKVFVDINRQIRLAAYIKSAPTQSEFEIYCAQSGAEKDKISLLSEALFQTEEQPAHHQQACRQAPKGKQPQSPPRQKRTVPPPSLPLSTLDEDTLVYYASDDPMRGSDNTLHLDFDCKQLSSAWCTFRQPLFEAKKQNRPWKICPHCANTPPMLLGKRSKKPYALNLVVMTDKEKKKARKARGF